MRNNNDLFFIGLYRSPASQTVQQRLPRYHTEAPTSLSTQLVARQQMNTSHSLTRTISKDQPEAVGLAWPAFSHPKADAPPMGFEGRALLPLLLVPAGLVFSDADGVCLSRGAGV